LSNRRSRSRFDYQKEERRKKKEETRIITLWLSRAKDSTFCPNSLQLKEDYLPYAIKKQGQAVYSAPILPRIDCTIIVGIIQITELKQTLRTLFVVTSPPVIINQES
jgi:hypothetical protein